MMARPEGTIGATGGLAREAGLRLRFGAAPNCGVNSLKPRLIVALGNPFSGDDGAAPYVADALWRDLRLPEDVEVLVGGTDLLRVVDQLVGRSEVFLLDALLDATANEPLIFFDPTEANLRTDQPHAHHLSAPASLELLTSMFAELKDTRFTWCLIPVKSASAWTHLSPEVQAQTHAIVELLLERLGVTPLELS